MGYSLANADWTRAMLTVQGHSTSNPNSIAQAAAVEAFKGPQDSVAAMLEEYGRRREWLMRALDEIPGFRCIMPEGAFYAFPQIAGLTDSTSFALDLVREGGVAMAPGVAFGPSGEGHIRFCFAAREETLAQGLSRFREFVVRSMAGRMPG